MSEHPSTHAKDLDGCTVRVYATIDGVRVSVRWIAGTIRGDGALCDRIDGPIDDPLEFIHACERVAGGAVSVVIGQMAEQT